MSEQDLRDLIEAASLATERWFAKKGAISPVWYAIDAQGCSRVLPSLADDKDIAVALARAMFELLDIKRYVFIDEAWMLDRRGGAGSEAEMRAIEQQGLREHPDRIEIVMFSAEDQETGQVMAHRKIMRPKGKRPYLAPLEYPLEGWGRGVQSEGRMVGLLPHKGAKN